MKTLIIDIQYFSPVIAYNKLSKFSHCVFEQYEWFQKMSFRNRCTLSGANGIIHLSIPLENGRDQKKLIRDVKIDYRENWQDRHWKTITSCYNRSPWFEFYRDELFALFQKRVDFLVDWNMGCFEWVAEKLGLAVSWSLSDAYRATYDEAYFEDWRGLLKPSSINKLFPSPPRYPQVFEERLGFIPNLSILDRLFCAGNKGLGDAGETV